MSPSHVLRLVGELDLVSVPPLRRQWIALADEDRPERIVVDLTDVTYIDGSCLGALLALLKRQRLHGGDLTLRGAGPHIARVLQLAGLTATFPDAAAAPDTDPRAALHHG